MDDLVGPAYPLDVPDASAIEDLAVATSAQPAQFFRWVAWQKAGSVYAAFSQQATQRLVAKPAHPPLTRMRLHRFGWQYGAGEAEFAALGITGAGEFGLATLAFGVEGGDRAESFVAPTGLTEWPEHWALARLGGRGKQARYLMVYSSASPGGTRVDAVAIGPGGTPAQRRLLAVFNDGPLLSLSLAPWGTSLAGSAIPEGMSPTVDLLFGPGGPAADTMTFARLSTDSDAGRPVRTWRLPDSRPRNPVPTWALPIPGANPVLLTSGQGSVQALAWQPELETIEVAPSSGRHLALLTTAGGLWAVWFDDVHGFQASRVAR